MKVKSETKYDSKNCGKYIGTCMRCGKQEATRDSYPKIICKACKSGDAYTSESSMPEYLQGFDHGGLDGSK